MDTEERLKWLEVRVSTSLRPRADELRNLFSRDDSKAIFIEFLSNDEAKRLFVFHLSEDKGGSLTASLNAPNLVREKCICFVKTGSASQLHSGNFDEGITCMDWSQALPHADLCLRDIFLPLLCTDSDMMSDTSGLSTDKLMDILHRLLSNIEISRGVQDGKVVLALPCIEVLAEAAAFQHRQPAVVHVLESAVVGWIRQIRNVLRHDALAASKTISVEAGEPIRPAHEIEMWEQHIQHTTSILEQLDAPVASDILMNLNHAKSAYAQSFGEVQTEIEQAQEQAKAHLRCFATVLPWIQDMYRTSNVNRMLKVFPPLLHTVLLIWKNSIYYHDPKPFAQLLKMLSNEVVARARSLVGENPFEDTQRSYIALKDALRLCAAFRGTYLDFKEKANAYNKEKVEATVMTMARLRPKDQNVLYKAKIYGPTGYQQWAAKETNDNLDESGQWVDSGWPPRNNKCFFGLSRFVERCNDLLDLVETTRHFLTLEEAARVGGAGTRGLDALISDIHQVFVRTIKDFTSHNHDVLNIDDRQHFERAFFRYRSVIKTLEHRLSGVLRTSIRLCPNAMSHLRVLEVFEGISARELLQKELQTENNALVFSLTKEFQNVKEMFESSIHKVPLHTNLPPTVSKLVWVRALKERVGFPMSKVREVCPHALESDIGWQLRDAYTDVMNDLEKYETRLLVSWSRSVDTDLRDRLKQPVLAKEDLEAIGDKSVSRLWSSHYDGTKSDTTSNQDTSREGHIVQGLKVNLDAKLLEMLRDVHYLQKPPHNVIIPPAIRALLRSIDSSVLQTQATRMRTVVSKYNHVVQRMQDYEQLLFENKMKQVDELISDGVETITWSSPGLEDYLEKLTSLICDDVHTILTRVHNNWDKVKDMSKSWSEGALDIFTSHMLFKKTKNLEELLLTQTELDDIYKRKLLPAGESIHRLLRDSFNAIEMSAASPSWQMYTAQMDAMVLMSLKSSILTSLDAMYTIIANIEQNEDKPKEDQICVLEIRLELVEQTVSLSPPLDRSSSVNNVEDAISAWLASFLKRSTLIKRLTDPTSDYADFLASDRDVWEVVEEIQNVVQANAIQCKQLLSIFDDYKFLWVQDVQQSFRDFLNGRPSPNPLRVSKQSHKRRSEMSRSTAVSGQRSRFSVNSPDAINEAERAFLTSNSDGISDIAVIPGLDDFNEEIAIYKLARDNISSLKDMQNVGWIAVNFQPIKQVLTTYASKWMWTFIRYLCDQVTGSLDTLADFLARTEPEIESITGEERDTASFMMMMRLFNEVSAQQQDMDARFAVMQKTVDLLEKYEMKLPNETQEMFKSAPDRWNHLKTKVSLAKQRLGPRIQEENERITHDLLRFSDRVENLASELRISEVFSRECSIYNANDIIDGFVYRLKSLQAEAQDLIELQELLEHAVVNFSVLPQYQRDLRNLKLVWDHVRIMENEQRDWKLKQWQKIDTKHLNQAVQKQKEQIQSLPPEVTEWDVYMGMIASVMVIEQCLPLVEDLNHPAMRTRHWKQLVRITGGLLQTDTDSLKKMVLGDLLELGLQKHADEVKAIVQRAVKDLTIESSLKTCEEVWLSKVFELKPHTRGQSKSVGPDPDAASDLTGSEMMPHALLQTYNEGSRTRTKSMKSAVHSRSSDKTGPGSVSRGRGGGRTSVLSLPISLLNLVDDPSPICLLRNVEKIFHELEHHQIELNRMQGNSAIGSFLDEVTKWQKKLHLVEAVLEAWGSVQTKWVQLDEVYSGADVRTALAHEANMYAVMSKDFRLLMRATEKNTNVLQSCSRKGLLPMLEKMEIKMEQCRHALLGNLERRRQRFPRFYFLSPEDVMNIVCYGYDLNAVNKYLCKILPHLGCLIFDEELTAQPNLAPNKQRLLSASIKKRYKVTGVSSDVGEIMTFHKPLTYEGPMSLWLPHLLLAIQATLQEHLHVALGNEPKLAQIEQTLRSSGATRVRISRPSSAISGGSQTKETPKQTATPAPPESSGGGSNEDALLGSNKPSEMAKQLRSVLGNSLPEKQVSWTLDNCTQVILLATIVQMNKRIDEALKNSNKQDCIIKVQDEISDNLHAAVIMLKGIEDEKIVRSRSARGKTGSQRRDRMDQDRANSQMSESLGPPSTRSLLEDEVYDDNFNDDAIGGGEGPIDTMQSLLFTENVRSGSRGTRRDVLEPGDQNKPEHSEVANKKDSKLLLFPSQVRKISSLIGILTQQRDVCKNLCDVISKEVSSGNLNNVFEWQARLKHLYDPENMEIKIEAMSWNFEYGYEYQGSCMRYPVSPGCDRVLLSILQCLYSNTGVAVPSTPGSHVILDEVSYQLGRALYFVHCSSAVDHYMLGDLFKGLAETGCWLCLEHFNKLKDSVLSVSGQLAAEIQQSLVAKKPNITLMSEEVNLLPSAACFVTLDGTGDSGGLNQTPFTSAAGLPEECISHFRIINAVNLDRKAVLEIKLLSQGFTQAEQLAKKLCVFLDLCGSLLATFLSDKICDGISMKAKFDQYPTISYHQNFSTSLALMEHGISGAGQILDNLIREQLELKQEYRDTILTKTRKFANIWRHRSSLMSSSGGLFSSNQDESGNEADTSSEQQAEEAIQVNKDRELIESDAESMIKMEELALLTAVRNIIAPRLSSVEDRSLVQTFSMDLFPDAEVDFGVDHPDIVDATPVPLGEFAQHMVQEPGIWDEENLNTEVNIPDHQLDSGSQPFQPKPPERETISDLENAIAIATAECHLSPSVSFQAKISQLAELTESLGSVIVCGSPGCGKSRAIEVYSEAQKQLGVNVDLKKVYVNALDSRRKLFGYFEVEGREWKDGLIQSLLRPHCIGKNELENESSNKKKMCLLHLDGEMNSGDTDITLQLLHTKPGSPSWLSLPNNERLRIPPDLSVIWELDSMDNISPSDLSRLGVVSFSNEDGNWRLCLTHWLDNLSQSLKLDIKGLVLRYVPRIVSHFLTATTPLHMMSTNDVALRLQQTVRVSASAMTSTFCKLMDCLLPPQYDSSPSECERYLGYAAFWAFGGTLEDESRIKFVTWWTETWPSFFPSNSSDPWRLFIDMESRNFARWDDHLPQFSGSNFVHTPDICQLAHLVGMLMDAGHPSLLSGPLGCGKSAIVRERVNTVSSGEVAEVLSLFVHCNRLTEAGTLWKRISHHLEWKHGVTYTPKGNKKLLCVVDDINLARPLGIESEEVNLQSACELVRQHLDGGGVRNPSNYKWQQVSNTTYVSTINPRPTTTSCSLNQRMTRHFSVFACPYQSAMTQHTIFSTLIQSYFLSTFGNPLSSGNHLQLELNKPLESLLSDVTMVTVELQDRLRSMYLRTPERSHYNFALVDLEKIFRNLMLSLPPKCSSKDLLLLWRHECDWIYGKRMVSDVDKERFYQVFDTCTKKYLTGHKYLRMVLSQKQPLFSSVRELDSGLVTAGRHLGRNSSSNSDGNKHETDYYRATSKVKYTHDLLNEAVKEFNKANVQMRLNLYEDSIVLVCRLARTLQSSHQTAHSMLFGKGCPVLAQLNVNLAAHLGGFRVVSLPPIITPPSTDHPTNHRQTQQGPSTLSETDLMKLNHFKQYIVQLYNFAGVKGEKIVFLLHDDRELTNECLTIVEELVRHGDISHLFTYDEQTTIANSVRSEVTAAGLTYSRDVAWNFFLNTVRKNLRIVLICSETEESFIAKCFEFSSLFNRMNTIALHDWNHEHLVSNALYHLGNEQSGIISVVGEEDRGLIGRHGHVMNQRELENISHLMATMHLAVKGKENNQFYKIPGHVSNYSFEKMVERFVKLFAARRKSVKQSQMATKRALDNIDRENAIAEALQKDLDREKQVLDEHKAGTLQLLAQIGQDMVITEQQVSAVRKQHKKIRHLKKTLPEYQLSHEKAVYKAAAIVADTKGIVKDIDVQALSELRSLQKPDAEVEDLMAAIIMILKSPNSDVTWSKGAKRQMANLDRFIDELQGFDEMPMPQGTLETLETFWEKKSFTPENLTLKAGGNKAAGALLQWVQGVVRYHTTMITRVKPLHAKVQETSSSIGDAQHKLRQLESKKEALEARLRDLAEGFEQATADKNLQEEKRTEMEEHLRVAAKFRQVLAGEHRRCCAVLNAYEDRLSWVVGASAIAAGFTTYLTPYPQMFRRMLLTVDWAQCLADKGIPLVFDSTDPVKGHVIEFMLDVNPDGALEHISPRFGREGDAILDAIMQEAVKSENDQGEETNRSSQFTQEAEEEDQTSKPLPPVAEETDAEEEEENAPDVTASSDNLEMSNGDGSIENVASSDEIKPPEVETTESRFSQGVNFHPYTLLSLPFISNEEYQVFLSSLLKLLVGEETLQEWLTKDFSHHQLQNAAVMLSSWQRPPLLLDPYLAGADWCAVHLRSNRNITPVNLGLRTETSHVSTIERSVLGGHTLMLMDCEHQAGALVRPLIHHSNTTGGISEQTDESKTVRFLGRRLLCPESFQLYLTTTQTTASKFHPDILAATQLISYVPSIETLQEDLLIRALQRVRPNIYRERHQVACVVRQHRHTLAQLDAVLCEKLVTGDNPKEIENSTKFLSNLVNIKREVSAKLEVAEELLKTLTNLAEELYPIAQRAAMLYSVCRAIPALNIHYQIPLPFFLYLFDSSVGNDFNAKEEEGFKLVDILTEEEQLPDVANMKRKQSLRLGSAKRSIRSEVTENIEKEYSAESFKTDSSDKAKSETIPTDNEDSDNATTKNNVIVPEVPEVPSEGVIYDSFDQSKVKEIIETLTKRIFSAIYTSVYPEHRLHVTVLSLLNIELESTEPSFTEEESTLLIHGNPGFGKSLKINLQDFECEAPVPEWLPADRFEDLLAYSVLPTKLEGFCVRVAEDRDLWKEWFDKSQPEKEPFPSSAESENLTDFQKLLIVKTMRPDRIEPALSDYVKEHIKNTPLDEIIQSQNPVNLETFFKDVGNTLAILVLLPDDDNINLTMQPSEAIKILAETSHVSIESVILGDGYQQEATRCITQAQSQDGWALINSLHLAPDKFFEDLQLQLARFGNISRQSEASNTNNAVSGSHFQVWLTSKSNCMLPSLLTQYLYKISWDTLLQLADKTLETKQEVESCILKSSLLSSICMVSPEIKSKWASGKNKSLMYKVCVCHAVLLARQRFGWEGNNRNYCLLPFTLNQALVCMIEGDDLGSVIPMIKNIYGNIITSEADKIYMDHLFDDVLVKQQKSELFVNGVNIPRPSKGLSVKDFSSWLQQNLPLDLDRALEIPKRATAWSVAQRGFKLSAELKELFNAVQQPGYESSLLSPGNTGVTRNGSLTVTTLQSVLDMCMERLPPLLELGNCSSNKFEDFDFPYHRPSILSSGNPDLVHMPESIGFVFLQECVWFNQAICKIRQQLHSLKTHLFVKSDYKLNSELKATAISLSIEEVPKSWQHPNEYPNTHVLLTWLNDIMKKYQQFRSWIKSGMVPLEGRTPVGNLNSIWLGGLVNPGSLLTALCQEKAVLHDVTLDQICINCAVNNTVEQEAGIYVDDVYIKNAMWDNEKVCITKSHDDDFILSMLPQLYFYPGLISDESNNSNTCNYPVYINMSRQCFVCYFPLPAEDTGKHTTSYVTDCDIILQSGPDLIGRDAHKSRAYLAKKRRDDWSRVSPAVSELMSRSGTRMSSAHYSLSGHRDSIMSTQQIMKAQRENHPDALSFESQPEHPQPSNLESVVSNSLKSLSSEKLTEINAAQPQEPLHGESSAARHLPNGDVKHMKVEKDSIAPPSIEALSEQALSEPSEGASNLNSTRNGQETEAGLFQSILGDQTSDEENPETT